MLQEENWSKKNRNRNCNNTRKRRKSLW